MSYLSASLWFTAIKFSSTPWVLTPGMPILPSTLALSKMSHFCNVNKYKSQEDEETLVVVVGKHFYFVRRSNAKNWVRLLSWHNSFSRDMSASQNLLMCASYNIETFGLGREPWSSGYGRRPCSRGRGFECQHRTLHGHFFTIFCCKL